MYLKPRIAPRGVKRKLVFNVRQETNAPVEETPCAPAVVKLRILANYSLWPTMPQPVPENVF